MIVNRPSRGILPGEPDGSPRLAGPYLSKTKPIAPCSFFVFPTSQRAASPAGPRYRTWASRVQAMFGVCVLNVGASVIDRSLAFPRGAERRHLSVKGRGSV
jgi:hypothetical protein